MNFKDYGIMNWLLSKIGLDGLKHLVMCLIIAGAIGTFLSLIGADFATAAVAALYAGEVAAVTKEWSDQVYVRNWSWKDLICDQVGIVLAIGWLVMWHFSKG